MHGALATRTRISFFGKFLVPLVNGTPFDLVSTTLSTFSFQYNRLICTLVNARQHISCAAVVAAYLRNCADFAINTLCT